jgi:DNA-binding transcriptional LysR family regulator
VLDWNDVQYFLAIHRAQTLLGASRELKVEHSTVGRRLAAMERALKAKLFVRTPSGFRPTPIGSALLPLAEQAETAMLQIERVAIGDDDRAEGTVKVTTSEAFARTLGRWLADLKTQHPQITVELLAGNRNLDLSRREADLAVRFSPTSDGKLVCRRVASLAWAPYASRSYVDARGGLPTNESLARHDIIAFDDSLGEVPGSRWLAEHGKGARIVLRSGSIPAACDAAVAGLGIAVIPCFLGAAQPDLVRIGPPVGTRAGYLVVHPDLARVARIRVVIAFLVERFSAAGSLFSGGDTDPLTALDSATSVLRKTPPRTSQTKRRK